MGRQDGLGPVSAGERLGVMDMLRGVALLGVFLMNIEWFSRPMQQMGSGIPADATGLDHAAAWFVHVFVAGKFWTLFSLLFGMGFVLMSERIAAAGQSVERVFARRMAALFCFGVLHIVLLWPGDILHTYALAGLLLMLMRGLSPKWQLLIGLLAYLGLCLFYLANAGLLLVLPADVMAGMQADFASAAATAAAVYPDGGFGAVTLRRVLDYAMVGLQGNMVFVPMVLAVFLVGSWLMRGGWLRDPASKRRFWWRLLAFTLPPGALFTAASVALGTSFPAGAFDPRGVAAAALMLLGALPLSLAYVALLVLAWSSATGARVLGVVAPAGRMALTHYLGQSLVCSLLFYGYGFGLWGELGRAAQTGLVLLVFALQVAVSHLWLARHRYGPMEWLWRWLTYGRRPAWRRDDAAATA
ncbi:DUF418 domain-containing protein [Luteimonas sp. BDR2-5]|uniref:DUF418 domain-containing protein n=1 Tax=Proluteimonas luteida TaxID=2878685 RepID=UPI001E51CDE3|nr:DUF418 domain-containing protein [Luteimonas sp. BDR2-5]MCD9029212.1 DUF418 domain-containing protein [Luteimonas sp. BDR2-5]